MYYSIRFSHLKNEMGYFELTWRTISDILLNEKHYVANWHAHYETIYETKETKVPPDNILHF